MMRRRVGITATLFLLASSGAVLMAPSPTAARTQRPRCLPHGAKTVAEDRTVRVYTLAVHTPGEHTYGCSVRTGRTVLLEGNGNQRHGVKPIALAGNFAAFADYQHGVDTGCTIIGVVDVVTATTSLKLPAGCVFAPEGSVVTDLVVDERGCVAWITSVRTNRQEIFQVRAASASGDDGLLDSGAQVAPHSLRLAPEGNISWVDAGSPQYWALPYHDCVAPIVHLDGVDR